MAIDKGQFPYSTKLTYDATKVDEASTNFAVKIVTADLPSAIFDADGATPAKNGGGDLRISSDADGATQLALEVTTFVTDNDPANGDAELWTSIPSLSASVDTDFYLHWGDATASQPAEDAAFGKEVVWNSNFKMVQHLNQDPSSSSPQAIDSTSNDNDGTATGGLTSGDLIDGEIGKGWNLDGFNDWINFQDDDSLSFLDGGGDTPVTFKAWVNMDDATTFRILLKYSSTHEYFFTFTSTDKLFIRFYTDASNAIGQQSTDGQTALEGSWHQVVATYDGSETSGGINLYIDGSSPAMTAVNAGSYTGMSNTTEVLRSGTYTGFSDGRFDEIQILGAELTANGVSTHYNNEASAVTTLSNDGVTVPPSAYNALYFCNNF